MKRALVLMILAAFIASCAAPAAVANGGSDPVPQVAQAKEPVPTMAQLEANLKQMEERYPKLVEAVQKMQQDILILRGAIAREKQLKGEEIK